MKEREKVVWGRFDEYILVIKRGFFGSDRTKWKIRLFRQLKLVEELSFDGTDKRGHLKWSVIDRLFKISIVRFFK